MSIDQIRSTGVSVHTWEFPWLGPVKVHLSDECAGEASLMHLRREVEGDDLLIAGVEAKPWRQLEVATNAHPLCLLLVVSQFSFIFE